MSKSAINVIAPPVDRALVFVCEPCGKRAGGSKRLSYELASGVKRKAKQLWGKGQVRVALTSCMDACPDNGISVSVLPQRGRHAAVLVEAGIEDVEAAADALLKLVGNMTDR